MAVSYRKLVNQIAATGLMSRAEIQALVKEAPAELQPKDGEQLAGFLVEQKKLTEYQSRQILEGNGQSLLLGDYVILDELGQGGMGAVLKARHTHLERTVAIKVLEPQFGQTPKALARFRREVKATSRLQHPNIVVAHDAGETDGKHYLVMEYIEGTNLRELVEEIGPLSAGQAVHCVLEAARGLEYAHVHGVVHRDVNPSNIVLDSNGVIRILDMGIARVESPDDEQSQLTAVGQILGTVDYMAPEQALDAKSADPRADIYSLGVTLWYVLTGAVPYPADTMMGKLVAHQKEPIPSLPEACPQASPEVDQVFRRMLAKSPEERYQTMTDVITDLEQCREARGSDSQ